MSANESAHRLRDKSSHEGGHLLGTFPGVQCGVEQESIKATFAKALFLEVFS